MIDEDHRWEGFGLALSDSSSQRGISSLFENILKAESWDEVLRRLREADVPENSVHELEQPIIPDTSIPATAAEENRSKPPLPEQATEPSSPNYPKKDSMPTRSTDIEDEKHYKQFKEEDETSKIHRSTQVRKDKGKEAEDWFRNELKKLLEPHNWRISDRPEKDEDNLESDIVLTHDQKEKYHIEVKHAEANALYWSIKEVEKARKNPKRYWMVIIRPTEEGQTGYRSILIEDPLETLEHNERSGTWIWQARDDNVPLNEGWYPPQPKPVKEANYFSFRISINDNCFNWNEFPDAFCFIKGKLIET